MRIGRLRLLAVAFGFAAIVSACASSVSTSAPLTRDEILWRITDGKFPTEKILEEARANCIGFRLDLEARREIMKARPDTALVAGLERICNPALERDTLPEFLDKLRAEISRTQKTLLDLSDEVQARLQKLRADSLAAAAAEAEARQDSTDAQKLLDEKGAKEASKLLAQAAKDLSDTGDLKRAERKYRLALMVMSPDADAERWALYGCELGELLFGQRRWQDAIAAFRVTVEVYKTWGAYNHIGQASVELARLAEPGSSAYTDLRYSALRAYGAALAIADSDQKATTSRLMDEAKLQAAESPR
jgi:tetratricopeptide (TPR) repeat protein